MSDKSKVEYRVSWTMWPFDWPKAHRTERVWDDEENALRQLEGLQSMLAPHDLRPCDKHVWDPRIEKRAILQTNWTSLDEEVVFDPGLPEAASGLLKAVREVVRRGPEEGFTLTEAVDVLEKALEEWHV